MTFLDWQASDRIAIIDGANGASLSYREIQGRSGRIADLLGPDKQLVFLLSRNDLFSATAYAATQLAGHALALLDGSKPMADQVQVLTGYRPRWIAGPPGTAAALAQEGLHPAHLTVLFGGELVMTEWPAAELYPDLAVLLATSGTTGGRKYVRLSRTNVEANARSIASYLDLTPDERPMGSLPLHYSFGLSVLNSHWLAGATIVLSDESVLQRAFWELVSDAGCTSLAGVPYTFQMLERIGYRDMDLPSVHLMQQAGGALDRGLTELYRDHMQAKGGRLCVMYGQTEASPRIAYVPPERLEDKLGSAGIAVPGGRLRIELSDRGERGTPATGEVIYEGPNVMLGYAEHQADLAVGDELHGVLYTGDIGYLDDEGFLFLTGRSKRIAKVFGLRVNLDEVEAMLGESGPAAVVAGEDIIWGLCAFGTEASVADLRDTLSRRLRVHKSALHLRRVDDIPVTPSGKTDYRQVERWVKG